MTATARRPEQAGPVIAIGITSSANTQLIRQILSDRYRLVSDLGELGGEVPDLLIVDAATLQRNHSLICRLRRQEEPMVLPVLMVSDLKSGPRNGSTVELGKTVDDIVRIPSTRLELMARIDNLLRLRHLSREQENARFELGGIVSALRTLNACDQLLVRARTEEELLESFCQNITAMGTYQLAWIGFTDNDSSGNMEVRACAGRAADCTESLAADWEARLNSSEPCGGDSGGDNGLPQQWLINHIEDETPAMGRHKAVVNRGLASVLLLPLNTDIGSAGYLAIYSDQPGHFGHEECQLLGRMASNLSHALNTLRFQQERDSQSARIHNLAYSDALTGLPNRLYLVSYLDEMLARSESRHSPSAAVLFVDLDGFKPINDVFGHETGDRVLSQVAQRLKHTVRESDLVIRQGGDEFLVVMFDNPRRHPPLTPGDSASFSRMAEELANRIIESIQAPMEINDHEHRLSASIGISLCPDHGESASTVIQAADNAMYDAKREGGGCCHIFSPQMLEKRQRRLSLEARLRRAIEQNELELHYQPIFDLSNLMITGAEALARWPQEDGGMVMPGDFIPVAEETGLIGPLGNWALATAARQLGDWHRQGHKLGIAVNLSVHQLHPRGDADRIAALVSPYVDPAFVTLEITESIIMVDPAAIEALLHKLRDHGFKIAIDDFGTGYSSLSRLQHLPLQTLKIDRSFVNQMGQEGKGAGMIPIIQQMASSFDLLTVAEGIETDAQYHQLCQAGIQSGQGYWFGRPVPATTFLQRLTQPDQ